MTSSSTTSTWLTVLLRGRGGKQRPPRRRSAVDAVVPPPGAGAAFRWRPRAAGSGVPQRARWPGFREAGAWRNPVRRGAAGGDHRHGLAAHPAPQLRHPPARRWCRRTCRPELLGRTLGHDHAGLRWSRCPRCAGLRHGREARFRVEGDFNAEPGHRVGRVIVCEVRRVRRQKYRLSVTTSGADGTTPGRGVGPANSTPPASRCAPSQYPRPLSSHGPAGSSRCAIEGRGRHDVDDQHRCGAGRVRSPCLLVDLDPQGALSAGLGVAAHGLEQTVHNLLVPPLAPIDDVLQRTRVEGWTCCRATSTVGGRDPGQRKWVGNRPAPCPTPGRRPLRLSLIDCQPSLGLLTVNALACADSVLIDGCEYFSLRGPAHRHHRRSRPAEPGLGGIGGILATMFDPRTVRSRDVMARVVERCSATSFSTPRSTARSGSGTSVAGRPIISTGAEVIGRAGLPRRRRRGHRDGESRWYYCRSTRPTRLPTECRRGFRVQPDQLKAPSTCCSTSSPAPARRHRGGAARVTDDFIAYHRPWAGDGPRTNHRVPRRRSHPARLEGCRLLPSGEVDDLEDLALLEARDLLFRGGCCGAAPANAGRAVRRARGIRLARLSRAVSLEDHFAQLLPEVTLGVDRWASPRSPQRH